MSTRRNPCPQPNALTRGSGALKGSKCTFHIYIFEEDERRFKRLVAQRDKPSAEVFRQLLELAERQDAPKEKPDV